MGRHLGILVLAALAAGGGTAARSSEPGGVDEALQRTGRLQGAAWLARNRPVVGAVVLVRPMERGSPVFVTASDGDGRFLVDGLADGDYRVELRRAGLDPVFKENVSVRFPARAVVEVRMEPAGDTPPAPAARRLPATESAEVSLHGLVVERGGDGLADARLRLVPVDAPSDPVVLRSDGQGRFDVDRLAAGDWRLEVSVAGFLPLHAPLALAADTELSLALVPRPAGYLPSPLELMPPERPVPPPPPGDSVAGAEPDRG